METNELKLLTERFLAGETTIDEELRLRALLDSNELTDEQKALRIIIAPPTGCYDAEAWAAEDESAVFDSMIKSRRRRALFVKLAAAAVLIGVIFIGGMIVGGRYYGSRTPHEMSQPIAHATKLTDRVRNTDNISTGEAKAISSQQAEHKTVRRPRTRLTGTSGPESRTADRAAAQTCTAAMTPYDSLRHIISNIERELQDVGDSVYIAHAKQLIETDVHLQQLVYKVMEAEMRSTNREFEAYNDIY